MAGIDRIAVLVRDPRDAVVSWWHHLERPDVKSWPWHAAMLAASGIQSRNYYELTWEEKLADLIERMYPSMQAWLMMWAKVIKEDPGFEFYLVKYEDLVANPEENYRKLFRFFGHDVNPVLPPKKTSDTLIDIGTHFRRGVVGSFRDEVPQNLMPQLQKLFDTRLTEFFGWRE